VSEKRSVSGLSKSHPQNFALICVKSRDVCNAANRFFARSPRKRELRETAQFQSLKSKRQKLYSASMTTCRTPVRKAAPDSAARPSTATSKTVSSALTIQSIIPRIGAPVISMSKLDRFVERPASFDLIQAGLLDWQRHQFSRAQNTSMLFQLTYARVEIGQPCAIFSGFDF
jgi:hypothetical protein